MKDEKRGARFVVSFILLPSSFILRFRGVRNAAASRRCGMRPSGLRLRLAENDECGMGERLPSRTSLFSPALFRQACTRVVTITSVTSQTVRDNADRYPHRCADE